VTASTRTASDWSIAGLLAVSIALWVLGDWQQAGSNPELLLYGASGVAWYVLSAVVVALCAARLTSPAVAFRQCLFLVLVAAPLIIVALWALSAFGSGKLAEFYPVPIFLIGAGVLSFGLRRFSGRTQARAVLGCVAAAGLIGWVSDALYVQPSVWYSEESPERADYQAVWDAGERLLFDQAERVDRAVGRVEPREAGRPNVFFVGFAGYGEQRVFAEEVGLAARVVGSRYGSGSRSVRLINDQRDSTAYPLATMSGLRRALLGVAQRMNLEDDILFLVLSSHGSEGAQLSVQNGGLPLQQLSGPDLADAIRDAGIRWKVIVISACYAGGFIDSLKDERSIILTAAASNRTSFGCSDDRDLTYFGEAFFRDALPGASSLRAAFTQANTVIGAREDEEGVEASDPQAFFGAALERYIGQLESGAAAGPTALSR
jgi:hypothetical protein